MAQSPDQTPRDPLDLPPVPVTKLGDGERLACLRLIRSENVGPVAFRSLINHYGGAEAALEALPVLARRGGRRRPSRICPPDLARRELDAATAIGATPIFTIEPGYPAVLAALDHPPPLIYVMGHSGLLNHHPTIAIVGSRLCSAAGAAFTRRIAGELGRAGFVVVSGLARGIDAAAHEASLPTGTIAVLAGGLDNVYPPEHRQLYDRISAAGTLVSERPPGFQPRGKDFPRRNRIISGMAHGVLVVEAARRSGSLTTARFAGEQGREVFAVPGHPLDPRAEGTNQLIKTGARIVTTAADIAVDLAPMLRDWMPDMGGSRAHGEPPPLRHEPLPDLDQNDRDRVRRALGPAPVTVDDLCRATALPARHVRTALLELALAGRVEHHGRHLVSLTEPAGHDTV